MKCKSLLALLVLCLLNAVLVHAGGVKGTVKGDDGELLSFATIYVKELGTGTTTNADARYEIQLPPGNYQIIFQYVGYESLLKEVKVKNDFIELDVELRTQVMLLRDIEILAGKEDPAYTIMRKAIAKSKFHTQQVDKYTARVYIKGTGQLTDYPFFMKGTLEKEGFDPDRVFITESVSDIEYIRPNIYNEKVISIYTQGDNNDTDPNAYVNGSFYEPEVAKSVSPLSPKAFSYYRFVYDGTYRDQGFEVSKIKVIPRSRGDNVFEGYINIVEGYWSIYSLDLKVTKLGVNFRIEQFYEPVEKSVWLPVTHKFHVKGKVLGFEFMGDYLATVSDYKVEINPDLDMEIEVIDENVEEELAEKLEQQVKEEETSEIQEMLTSGQEVTRKQLRKVMKEYEKMELKRQREPEVISNRTFKVDSMAYKQDSVFWAGIRPVPLTQAEKKGYATADSLANVERMEREGDTLKTGKRKGFHLQDIIVGNTYKLADKTHLQIHTPLLGTNYNTVEGFNIDYAISFTKTFDNKSWISLKPTARYAFAREQLSGKFDMQYGFGEFDTRSDILFSFGRYINQYNDDEPINRYVNSLMTLFLERNYMKIYEKDFLELTYKKKLNSRLAMRLNAQLAERSELYNNTDYRFFDIDGEGFTPNAPFSLSMPVTSFPEHRALTAGVNFEYKPFVKYRIYNGKKSAIEKSSPIFQLNYKKGISGAFDSDVDYDMLELGFKYDFDIGIRGQVDVMLKAGTFLNNDKMYFMDYKHFLGNRTPFVTTDPVGSFRMLDYYTFSTNEEYFAGSLHYQFRKFLITRMPLVRLSGVRESFFTNYLINDVTTSSGYTELGYGINYILRVFRLEAVTSFYDGKYQDFGVRIGIATNFEDIF
ncbi:DUF5686 and carboxypeptidase regulatory-like domain-containing protein [Fulvivirga ulvae]|uniref:DUF5686 and carboxypeptidase regulatory-like domain-containing protein n=1 Tax=Fulvivirga ulvae TaxID=2904245 RepID=UPI001F4260E9|nr:DUF5686 and carboxypeptidase regulatory-like domain-containing protein [Fulvivirga ulvae]UII34763.1 DUF5686 and carboxypeptidase regulatory-like domain-containing protein [Fulvivirga ulvae]